MTEVFIKEQISFHYLGTLISSVGHKMIRPTNDFGVDALISQIKKFTFNNKTRLLDSGRVMDLQLKCTTKLSIHATKNGDLKYDLNAKNYNDLIIRRPKNTDNFKDSLVLIILILQDNENWLFLNKKFNNKRFGLNIPALAYWYIPEKTDKIVTNKKTKRITLNKENIVDSRFLQNIFSI